MKWDSVQGGLTECLEEHSSGCARPPPDHFIEWVNVYNLPRGLREARLIPCFMMVLMRLFQNLLNLPFIAIKLHLLIQILMPSSLFLPQSPISSAPVRLPLLWSVGMTEEQNKDITEQNSDCPLISATSFTARLQKQAQLSPGVHASVQHTGVDLERAHLQ